MFLHRRDGQALRAKRSAPLRVRGGDDLTYVLSGLVAAKVAKAAGVRSLILQIMLNTRRQHGHYSLAKARALLHLVRELGAAV